MRRIKMLLMSAVLTLAMLVGLAGPAMADDRFCCDGFVGPRFLDGDPFLRDIDRGDVVFVPIDEDCDFAGTREIDDVTLVFLECD